MEAEALGAVMAERPAERPCSVGSIKTNLGHLDAAAGALGEIDVLVINDGHGAGK